MPLTTSFPIPSHRAPRFINLVPFRHLLVLLLFPPFFDPFFLIHSSRARPPLHLFFQFLPLALLTQASYADPTKRITEYVSRYSTLAQVVDLLHDHRLTGGVDPETCLYVCKRTTGTTISNFGLPFDANSTLSNVYSRVAEMLQNQGGYSKFRHLTFVPAYDGNVHIIVDKVEEPRVKTEMFPRPTLPKEATRPVAEKKEGMLVNLSNQVHIERVKQEMVVNEYPHPHRPSAYYPRMDE
jgi:hypothetical protein